jgi:formylglycine-generating enzyme required for sulfatase activity
VKDTSDPEQLRRFITQYPSGPRRRDAEERLAMMLPVRPAGLAPLTAAQERALKPKDVFRECENCPEMVVVPAGAFTMGSPDGEKDREIDGRDGPQHTVTIGRPFAVGKFHVTRDQFAVFANETGYTTTHSGCDWRSPGFTQEGSHPVVCVMWNDAKAYVGWVAKKTGKSYRLLSEAEFEYAARGKTSPGTYPRFWFGDNETDLCRYGNGVDQKAQDGIPDVKSWTVAPCNDGYAYTSPAGYYQPNAFGLHDMFGNAWQWMEDCWHKNYDGAPANGSAWTADDCKEGRVIRGGSWLGDPSNLRAAERTWAFGDDFIGIGFRLARSLNGPDADHR